MRNIPNVVFTLTTAKRKMLFREFHMLVLVVLVSVSVKEIEIDLERVRCHGMIIK